MNSIKSYLIIIGIILGVTSVSAQNRSLALNYIQIKQQGDSCCNLKDYNTAIDLYETAYEILNKLNIEPTDEENELWGQSRDINSLLRECYYNIGDIEKALFYGRKEAEEDLKMMGIHASYLLYLYPLVEYALQINRYDEAIDIIKEILEINQLVYGDNSIQCVQPLIDLSDLYFFISDQQLLTSQVIQNNNEIRKILHNVFTISDTEFRAYLWNSSYEDNIPSLGYWFNEQLPFFSFTYPNQEMVMEAYNGILMSKGILLNMETELAIIIGQSKDKDLIESFNKFQNLKSQISQLYPLDSDQKKIELDSLNNLIYSTEQYLIERSSNYGDYTRNLSISWQDVQKGLKDKDVAIEFVSFELDEDSTMYMAYVLKPDMEAPEMVKLFEEKDLTSLYPSTNPENIYHKEEASDLIWRKLEPYLEGCENVYFAPDGVLHQIAIEYFTDPDSEQTMAEKYNMYRLSSTRQLALKHERKDIQKAVLYGGIEFNSDTTKMAMQNRKYDLPAPKDRGGYYGDNLAEDFKLRAYYDPLPGTKVEVEDIEILLKQGKKETERFSGDEASEASFKSLSGSAPQILHIATHGFYWSEEQADTMAVDNECLLFMSSLANNGPWYVEDKTLTRSGLLMAGANNTLMKKPLPEGVDDGILTAQEIAQLNLRALDLVVLSACQTGLGDIGSDGVFGLQRGFKKAGANTLLMSLWNVNDEATRMLMTEFYKNYISGQSKRESLLNAQKVLQNHPKYYLPRYWAGFILLDALN